MFPRISRCRLVLSWWWLAGLFLGGLSTAAPAEDPFAAGVRATEPLPPAEQRARFQLPPGFEIQLVATEPEINKPMNLAFDATGRLWVTTSIEYPWAAPTNRPGRDRLMVFADFGPDGRARKVTTFAEGLNIPIGVYPFRGPDLMWKAVVWSIPHIWLLEDTDGDDRADRRTILYGPFDTTRDTHGNQASFRRGWDGWLYATHGFNNDSHVTARDGSHVDLNSGNTYRIRLDGSRIEHHTHGQVNPFGLAWDPWGDLYSSDCHSAPVYQLLGGGYYPSFGKPHDGLGFAPTMIEHAHGSTAIDGLVYVADDLWPAEYQDHVFIGNVMTSRLNHDQLEWLGATPRAVELPDFLTTTDPWFRPVDNCFGPDGALYIADFYNRIIGHYEVPLTHPGRDRERGRIWRVIPTGRPLRPAALAADMPGLIGELGSGSLTRRMLAGATLVDRYGAAAVPGLKAVLAEGTNRLARIHAAALLPQLGVEPGAELDRATALSDPDPQRRAHGLRMLTEAARLTPTQLVRVQELLTDPEARVVRRAAETLGRHPVFESLAPLLHLRARVPVGDTHLTYVVRKALRDHLLNAEVLQRVLATEATWSAADNRVFADVLLAVPSAGAGTFLLRHLSALALAPAELSSVLVHAARHVSEAELPQLTEYSREHFANDPRAQLALFNSVDQGLKQRGLALPASVRGWGEELATRLVEQPDGSAGWYNTPLEIAPTGNPWNFEERTFADGTRGRVLSSLPGGEGLTGRLRSPEFAAPQTFGFWACGHDGDPAQAASGRNVFRLVAEDTGEVLRQAPPPRSDTVAKIVWDLTGLVGRRVHFEVVDAHTGSAYAWLAVGQVEAPGVGFPAQGLRTVVAEFASVSDVAIRLGLRSLAPKFEAMALQQAADSEVRVASARAAVALAPDSAIPRLGALLGDATQPAPVREGTGAVLAAGIDRQTLPSVPLAPMEPQ